MPVSELQSLRRRVSRQRRELRLVNKAVLFFSTAWREQLFKKSVREDLRVLRDRLSTELDRGSALCPFAYVRVLWLPGDVRR